LKPLAIVSLHASPVAALGAGENGGMNVYVRAVCEELSRRGIATEVFTRRSSAQGPDRIRLADRSWVTRLAVGPADDIDKARLFDLLPDFSEAILSEQRRRRAGFALVHSHYWLSGWVAARLRDEWILPWFHTFHTLARVKNEQAAEGAVVEPEHRIAVEQAIVRNCDRLIASSAQEAEDLVRLYGATRSRLSVVAPGVDLEVFTQRPTAALRKRLGLGEAPVVVFAGRLERLKGAETVIRAMAHLQGDRTQPNAPVLLVSGADSHNGASESRLSGGEQARLMSLANSLGIGGLVRFLGSVDQPALAGYLSLASVCVVPSYSESFGLVALEAQACGCPVVASGVSGLRSVVRDEVSGYLIYGHDPVQYAERIGRLLADPELAQQMGRRSSMLAQRFSWSRTADRLFELFEGLSGRAQLRVHAGIRQE